MTVREEPIEPSSIGEGHSDGGEAGASQPGLRDRRPMTGVLIANAVSMTGDSLAAVAIPWFVLETTGSAARAGLTGGAAVLPALLAGIFGGTFVDRVGPKRASVLADVVGGTAILLIPLLYATVGLAFWQLLVLVLLAGALDVPGITARRAMLPELAKLGGIRLERVNSILEGNQMLATLLGPPIAGVAIGWFGAEQVLWADAATFALSAGVVAKLVPGHLYPQRARDATTSYMVELKEGLRFLWNDRLLRAASASLAVTNATGGAFFAVIFVVYARERFESATYLGLLFSAIGLGSLLGALGYGAVGYRLPRRWVWCVGYLLLPIGHWMFAFEWPFGLMLGVLLLLAIAGGAINPLLVTVRMERIPVELRGRVFATSSAIAMGIQPIGIILGGALVEWLGLRAAVVLLATIDTAMGIVIFLLPVWKHLDDSRPERVQAAAA